MANGNTQTFGSVIRARRRQLNLTQEELAVRIKSSVPYIGHLETGKRHPSANIVTRLAEVLGLDLRELFFLANPETKPLVVEPAHSNGTSAWEAFRGNVSLLKLNNITEQELQALSGVAMLGNVRSPRDFMFILNTIRQALG